MKKYLFYISQLYSFAIVRPLQTVIVGRGDVVAWFFDNPKKFMPYLRPNEKCLKTVAEVKEFDPCAVFVPGNAVPDFFPGIKVQLFHGFPARKRPSANPSKDGKDGDYRVRGMFDLYCTQGPSRTNVYEDLSKFFGYFEVAETGWPKMDPLFANNTHSVPKKNHNVVLLTSTFTPRLSGAPELFETVKQIAETGTWKWLVNFHPKMAPEVIQKYKSIQSENLVFVETDDIIPLLKAADVMVSDTSSVISEFLLQHKPVVTFKNHAPEAHLINITEPDKLKESIVYALTRPGSLIREIMSYSDSVHPYRDGRSSIRVLEAADRFVAKGRDHLKSKPFNLIRSLKIRRQLGYFRF